MKKEINKLNNIKEFYPPILMKINKNLLLFKEEKLYQFYKLSKFLFNKDCNSFMNRAISPNKTNSTVSIQGDLIDNQIKYATENTNSEKGASNVINQNSKYKDKFKFNVKSDSDNQSLSQSEKGNLNISLSNNFENYNLQIKENKFNKANENNNYNNNNINSNCSSYKNIVKVKEKFINNLNTIDKDNLSEHSKDEILRNLLYKKQPPNLNYSIKENDSGIGMNLITDNNNNKISKSPNEFISTKYDNNQIKKYKNLSDVNTSK